MEGSFTFRPQGLPSVVEYVEVVVGVANAQRIVDNDGVLPMLSKRAVSKRKNEFYSGRWAATEAIRRLTGVADTPAVNTDRSPEWPEGLIGSISHTQDYAVAIVGGKSKVSRIGVDLESIRTVASVANLSGMISVMAERMLLSHLPVELGLALLFSAKESLYKSLYPQANVYFDYLDAELVDLSESSVALCLKADLGDAFNAGDRFEINYLVKDGHVLTWQIDLR